MGRQATGLPHGPHSDAPSWTSPISTCFFDLDDTLYPSSSGIAQRCKANILDTMVQMLGFDPATVESENMGLYRKYGTTMAGLRAEGYAFSFDKWHNLVHAPLPYDLVRPDPALRSLLHSMPQRKFVFTNSDRGHAARCLSRLGVEDCVHGVIAFEDVMEAPPLRAFAQRNDLPCEKDAAQGAGAGGGGREAIVASWQSDTGPQVCCKPQVEAFLRALSLAGTTAEHSMMFDDSAANIAAAKRVGLRTVLVGSTNHVAAADYCIASIHNVHGAVPELWEGLEVDHPSCPCCQVLVQAVQA